MEEPWILQRTLLPQLQVETVKNYDKLYLKWSTSIIRVKDYISANLYNSCYVKREEKTPRLNPSAPLENNDLEQRPEKNEWCKHF